MTEVLFYHLQNMSLENVLPPLLEKSLERGWRVVEVPTVWIDQEGSRVSAVSDSRRMGTSLIRLWLRRRVFA